jgi:hypothetical protein
VKILFSKVLWLARGTALALAVLAATLLAATLPAVALAAGNDLWTRQFGTTEQDIAYGTAVYGTEIYAAGITWGAFPGKVNQGQDDIFVRKYGSDGAATWTRQFGSSDDDTASGTAADSSGVYVAGGTRGALPNQNAGNYDAFVRKYGLDGTTGWTKQFGTTGYDFADGVALDAPRGLQTDPPLVYVVGGTSGTLPGESSQGSSDAYARAYKKDGSIYWTEQFGTSAPDGVKAVAGVGSVAYVAGRTDGTFSGQMSKGSTDAFLRKYD